MGARVKITAIETHIIGNPWKNWVLVKLLTDEGISGWGDATNSSSPLAVQGAVTEISRFCVGKDPLSPRQVWEEMFIALNLPVRGTILSAMVTTLREGGARTQPRVVAHHLLRALGVPDRKAREIAESPLPEIVAAPC